MKRKPSQYYCLSRCVMLLLLFLLLWGIVEATSPSCNDENTTTTTATATAFCIDRKSVRIRVMLYGIEPLLLHQIHGGMDQMAKELLGITLIKDTFSSIEAMNYALENFDNDNVDGLIISIPHEYLSQQLKQHVHVPTTIINHGTHFFHSSDPSSSSLSFVSQDAYLAGSTAANEFLNLIDEQINFAYYITTLDDTNSLTFHGFRDVFSQQANIEAKELVVVDANDFTSFSACPRQHVAVFASTVGLATKLLDFQVAQDNACSTFHIGALNANYHLYSELSKQTLNFIVSEQGHLQGSLSILKTVLQVTTSQTLIASSENLDLQATGPIVLRPDNAPPDTYRVLQDLSFPTCTQSSFSGNNNNNCVDRSRIKIATVLPIVTNDNFWRSVLAGINQAAVDMQVDEQFELYEFDEIQNLETNTDAIHGPLFQLEVANKITDYCQSNIDGLVVSIPSSIVYDALSTCFERNIPVISMNKGMEYLSKNNFLLHHIGQDDYDAGYQAGQRLISNKYNVTKAYCITINADSFHLRCQGFEDAIAAASNVEFGGSISVPLNDVEDYKRAVEDKIELPSIGSTNWDGIGLLLVEPEQLQPATNLANDHPNVTMAIFDQIILQAQKIPSQIKFSIEQQPYLQGYLPIVLLTTFVATKQKLNNGILFTGPSFMDYSDFVDTHCSQTFPVCPTMDDPNDTNMEWNKDNHNDLYKIRYICSVLVIIVAAYLVYRIHKLQQHVEKMKKDGVEISEISWKKRMFIFCCSVDNFFDHDDDDGSDWENYKQSEDAEEEYYDSSSLESWDTLSRQESSPVELPEQSSPQDYGMNQRFYEL